MKTSVRAIMIKAKECLIKGDNISASNNLNIGLVILSQLTLNGVTQTEGASVDRWKERFWYELEENGLIED